jgi:hypothetical protein
MQSTGQTSTQAVSFAVSLTSMQGHIDTRLGDDVGHRFYPPVLLANKVIENYILKIDD